VLGVNYWQKWQPLDEQTGKLALSHGKEMLAAAADHVSRLGIG